MSFTAIEPDTFPWFEYRGYTFSLGLKQGESQINSGHSGSAFDAELGKVGIKGGMGEQAATAYAKQKFILEAGGRSLSDVTRVVDVGEDPRELVECPGRDDDAHGWRRGVRAIRFCVRDRWSCRRRTWGSARWPPA